MKKLLVALLIISIVCSMSVSAVALDNVIPNDEIFRYSVGEKYFDYLKSSEDNFVTYPYWNHFVAGAYNQPGNTIIITDLSDEFGKEIVIPDEIDGFKINNVVLADYTNLETVILGDGIQRFVSYMQAYGSDGEAYREENNIKTLSVGKEFLPEGFYSSRASMIGAWARMENLEMVEISALNPYLNTYKGAVYSEDFSSLVLAPIKSTTKNFVLKNGIKSIGDGAFAFNNKVEKIKRIKYVKSFGKEVFYKTKKIKNIILGDNVKEINKGLFRESNIKSITLGDNIKTIGEMAFYKTKMKKIVLSKRIKTINNSAFWKAKLEKVVLNNKVKNLKYANIFSCRKMTFVVKTKIQARTLKHYFNKQKKNGRKINVKICVGNKLVHSVG